MCTEAMDDEVYQSLASKALSVYSNECRQHEVRLGQEKIDGILGVTAYLRILDKMIKHHKEAINNAGD